MGSPPTSRHRSKSANMSRFLVTVMAVLFAMIAYTAANGMGQGPPPAHVCTEDGFFADYYRGCHVFYHCDGDTMTTYGCPRGFLFSETIKACVSASHVQCPYPY